jgi:hypothetical protein
MTTTWIAGADPVAMPAPAPAAPVYSVGGGACGPNGCGDSTWSDTYSGESEGFFSKLMGHFHHSSGTTDCGCCGDCGCGGCDTGCDTGHGGGGLLDRLKGMFHHASHDVDCGCCDGCGNGYGAGYGTGVGPGGVISPVPSGSTMPKVEPLGPPKELKKLPNGEEKKTPDKEKKEPEKEKKEPEKGKKEPEKKEPEKDKKPAEKEKKNGSVELIPQPVDAPELDIAPTSGKSPF